MRASFARESEAALVVHQIEGGAKHRVIAGVDSWTAGHKGLCERRSAIILEWPELGIARHSGHAASVLNQVAVIGTD